MESVGTSYSYFQSDLGSKIQAGMECEVVRLASFDKWPVWAVKRPTELADNGFYYCGYSDQVKCYSCGGEISNWSVNNDVAEEHRKQFPHCLVVIGLADDNRKLGSGYLTCYRSTVQGSDDMKTGCTILQNVGSVDQVPDKCGTSNSIDDAEKLLKEMKSFSEVNQTKKVDSAPSQHPQPVGFNNYIDGKNSVLDPELLRYELYRQQTFDGKWPDNSFISPAELAKAGFYYVGPRDTVRCTFCSGKLVNWKATDNPMFEHRRHHPHCPFVRGEATENVSIESVKNEKQSSLQKESSKKQTSCECLGVMVDKPKFPEYAIETARKNSFAKWPKNSVIDQKDLVKAGFFYVGYSDNVKCFFCGGGLRNWEKGDNPWTEHARWFSKCGFLKLNKGESFIQAVLNPVSASVGEEGNSESASRTGEKIPFDPSQVDEWISKPDVKTVISMGFSIDLVKQVIKHKLKTTGQEFTNVDALLEAVLNEKENVSKEIQDDKKSVTSRRKRKNRNRKKKSGGKLPIAAGSENGVEEEDEDEAVEFEEILQNPASFQDEELLSLLGDYEKLKEERTCKICMDAESSVVFLPCGHIVCCSSCAPVLRTCPICRSYIKGSVRAYMP